MPQDELRFQYPLLALKLPDDETFASFYPGQNADLLTQLKNSVVGLGVPVLYMWGESGSGRHTCYMPFALKLMNGAIV